MVHFLTLGYLEAEAVPKGQTIVLRPLDMNLVEKLLGEYGELAAEGQFKVGGFPVQIKNGTVVCPWFMPGRVSQAERFARRLAKETGCLMADFTNRRIVTTAAFMDHLLPTPLVGVRQHLEQESQELK